MRRRNDGELLAGDAAGGTLFNFFADPLDPLLPVSPKRRARRLNECKCEKSVVVVVTAEFGEAMDKRVVERHFAPRELASMGLSALLMSRDVAEEGDLEEEEEEEEKRRRKRAAIQEEEDESSSEEEGEGGGGEKREKEEKEEKKEKEEEESNNAVAVGGSASLTTSSTTISLSPSSSPIKSKKPKQALKTMMVLFRWI